MIYKPKGARIWMAKWKYNGQDIRRSTGESNEKAARRAAVTLQYAYLDKENEKERTAEKLGCDSSQVGCCAECEKPMRLDRAEIGIDGAKLCGDMHCREVWNKRRRQVPILDTFLKDAFLPFCRNRKAKTQDNYAYGVSLLVKSAMAKLPLDQITAQHAAQFIAGQACSPSTTNCALRTLRRGLKLAEEWGNLEHAPKIKLAEGERQRDRVVRDDEFAPYLELCQQPYRDIAILIRYEALRPWSEAAVLRWENILLNSDGTGLILIIGGKSRAARRQLPMTPEVFAALKARHVEQGEPEFGWIFPANTQSGHTEESSAKYHHLKARELLKAATKARQVLPKPKGGRPLRELPHDFVSRHAAVLAKGIPPFEPYSLRHTCLTRLAEAGCDPFTLARIAGHTNVKMTDRYVHPQAEAIARAFQGVTKGSLAENSTVKSLPGFKP
jgi:integrase